MVRIRMHDQGLLPNLSKTSLRQPHLTNHLDKKINKGFPPKVIYYQFPELSKYERLVHAVFTRNGGVSEFPYATLNTSYSTGDRPECVKTNHRIIKETIGARHLTFMKQLHGQDILVVGKANYRNFKGEAGVDAIITDMTDLALMVKQADCQGVILFDPQKRVISNVHCGWRGNTYNILGSVVRRMESDFGCEKPDLVAAIGPSLGPCCAEFVTYEQIFPKEFKRFMVRKNYFDLWEISRWQLLEAGLKKENIEVAGICTRCRTDQFYSYRAKAVTGRFATAVMLK